MGVGGNFWDLLKPYARNEGFDFLRNKRVAVDLSFWIVQHGNAIKTHVRKPHLRLTFFRTINLFSKVLSHSLDALLLGGGQCYGEIDNFGFLRGEKLIFLEPF